MRSLSIDIETKVLSDLDEKIHRMAEMLVHRPELVKLLNKNQPILKFFFGRNPLSPLKIRKVQKMDPMFSKEKYPCGKCSETVRI
jgi:hypothetical protein